MSCLPGHTTRYFYGKPWSIKEAVAVSQAEWNLEPRLSNVIALKRCTAFPVSMALGVSVTSGWSLIIIEMVIAEVILSSISSGSHAGPPSPQLPPPAPFPSLPARLSGWFLRSWTPGPPSAEPFIAEAALLLSAGSLLPSVFRGDELERWPGERAPPRV